MKNDVSAFKIANLYDSIFNQLPDMFILCNTDATILDIRHPQAELISKNPKNIAGRHLSEVFIKDVPAIFFKKFEETVNFRKSQKFAFQHIETGNRKKYFYEATLFPLDAELLMIQIRTIDEKLVSSIESEHLHHFFSEVIDNIAIPVSVKNMYTGRYVYWSKKAELFGRTACEMIGGTEELYMTPEQACRVQQIDKDLAEGTKKQYQGIEKYITNDGKEHTFIVTRTLFIFGNEKLILSSALDISELTETKSSLLQTKNELAYKNMVLSSILNLANVIPWGCDLTNKTFYCDYNTYHPENASGPNPEGRYVISMKHYFSSIHPDYRSNATDLFTDLIDGHITEFHDIYPIHWYNDESYEWVEVQSSRSKHENDSKLSLLIGSVRVITAQKQLEKSLRDAKEQAEQSNLLKSAFLANMSHEIRTPLNSIVGFSELLSQTEVEEEKKEYLNIIQNSNALLLQLIGDILDLSKIEAGTLEFVFGDHDLNALMEELEQTARMKITNPAIEVACTHQIPDCTIHTDRGRLLQVLHNFINNAAKFTKQGHIHFGYRKHPDGRWYFYVEDTGCGIPNSKKENVFERFVKLDSKVKGTGLGLAISKSIIERLGGKIGVYSAEGIGSTFWFLLPAGSITAPAATETTAKKISKPDCTNTTQTTLLIAEDDPANYKLFEAMLKRHYRLLHAWNGREAIEIFKEQQPDMILMDIKMPEIDGYEATAVIRKLSANIPIVAVTAFAYPEDMRRILSCGFSGCLPKPVNADNLKKKISELCPFLRKKDK